MTKHRIRELSHFNAIASMLVVLIHVVSFALSALDPSSWQMAVLYIPSRLSAFVVPGFLFVGAVKMAVQMDDTLSPGQYFRYLLSRVRKIWLPYLIWNFIYFFAFLRIGYVRSEAGELVQYILTGTLSSPFYYVLIVMQFYALLPLWRWIVKKVPFPTAACWAVLITFLSLGMGSILNHIGLDFPWSDRIFGSYLIFWISGLYAGRNYDRFSKQLCTSWRLHGVSLALIFVFCGIAYLGDRGIWIIDLTGPKFFVDLLSISLLLWLSIKLEGAPQRLLRILEFLYRASFFTYLSHCLFLTLSTHYAQIAGITDVSTLLLIRALASYGCPLVLYWLYERIKSPKN